MARIIELQAPPAPHRRRLARYLARLTTARREHGVSAALRQLADSLRWRLDPQLRTLRELQRENAAFDRTYGTDTRAEVHLAELGVPAAAARAGNGLYRGVSRTLFRHALARLDLPLDTSVFVDYGSGKGKALMLATEYPFRRIVGVEFARALHEAALANLRRHPGALAFGDAIEACCGDARAFEPPVAPLVCFFFNPFDATVWRDVLARLDRHRLEHGLPIHIVYLNIRDVAELGDVFAEFPAFAPVVAERHLVIRSAPARRSGPRP